MKNVRLYLYKNNYYNIIISVNVNVTEFNMCVKMAYYFIEIHK